MWSKDENLYTLSTQFLQPEPKTTKTILTFHVNERTSYKMNFQNVLKSCKESGEVMREKTTTQWKSLIRRHITYYNNNRWACQN